MSARPLQNRVTPRGEIIADPARGTLMGNRGILHGPEQRLGARRWTHKAWIACEIEFRGRHRKVMQPRAYTELFFLDEAVALAAGHRPCAECRRADYNRFRACWQAAHDGEPPRAAAVDAMLHAARLAPGRAQRTHRTRIETLPGGVFVEHLGGACLFHAGRLFPYTPYGYMAPGPAPVRGAVTVLTPRPMVAVLAAGYRPRLHPSAA